MQEIHTRLPDGTPMVLRDVDPRDAEMLRRGFARLSAQSRIYRFLRAVKNLPPGEIERFVTPDGTTHVGIGAVLLGPEGREPAGIAHFFRTRQDCPRAEIGLAVVDPYQSQGIGSLLLGLLARRAVTLGIERLDAMVMSENRGMAKLMRGLGANARREGSVLLFDLALHDDADAYPETRAGAALRRAWTLARDAEEVRAAAA